MPFEERDNASRNIDFRYWAKVRLSNANPSMKLRSEKEVLNALIQEETEII